MERFKESAINFHLDLKKKAVYHLLLLRKIDSISYLRRDDVLHRAVQRYEKIWLPLAAKYDTEKLVAPLDIQWMWHCHMLCPNAYVRDCHDLVGKVIDHELVSPEERQQRLQNSYSLWIKLYPHEPFEINVDSDSLRFDHKMFKSSLSYDLLQASKRQAAFFYQVSLPHYHDSKFLQNAVVRYKKFLFLKKNNPKVFLVPCYDIDLVWHTHQLHPGIYKTDTEKILGRLFNHDDTVNDRSPDSKLSKSDLETRELWRNTFHEAFSMYGAMYRGDPPAGKLYHLSSDEIFALSSKTAQVTINSINVEGLSCEKGTIKIKVSSVELEQGQESRLFKLKGTQPSWNMSKSYIFDTLRPNRLKIDLVKQTGFSVFGNKRILGQYSTYPLSYIESFKKGQSEPLNIKFLRPYIMSIAGHISAPQQGIFVCYIDPGEYETAIIPEDFKQMWGPVPLQKHPAGTENTCNLASHRLVNHTKQVVFSCKIIHSIQLMMSAIHVFYHNKMAAVVHTIGSNQLPLPTQINMGEGKLTLNPAAGERAVLIKNHRGDWGVVTGKWTGFSKGIAGLRGTPQLRGVKGSPGCPGWLEFTFYKFDGNHFKPTINMDYRSGGFAFKLNNVTADLKKGSIKISCDTQELAENIAIVFAVSLLHVLCVPRPSNWKPGNTLKPTTKKSRGSKSVQYVASDDMVLIMACGFMINTPSNHYIHHTYESNTCAGCGSGCMGEIESGFEVDNGCVVDTDEGGDCDGGGCGGCGGCGGSCGGCLAGCWGWDYGY